MSRVPPNKRLKLAAPGLGRIPFLRQHTSCASVIVVAPAGWGAAAYARSVRRLESACNLFESLNGPEMRR